MDTQAVLCLRSADSQLNQAKWKREFNNPNNEIFFSLVSLWEITIKCKIGKLKLDEPLTDFAEKLIYEDGFKMLPVDLTHVVMTENLPLHHRDPFDRLLIAQAIVLNATAVSNDLQWKKYPIRVQW